MQRTLLLLLVVVVLGVSVVHANNMYTTCATNGASDDSQNYWWWWWSSSYIADAHPMNLPSSQHYSVPITSNNDTMLYFNVCGPTDICNGALACVIGPSGVPDIFAYPNSNPYYYTYSQDAIQMEYYLPIGPSSKYFNLEISCGSVPFQVNYVNLYDDDDLNVQISSSEVCNPPTLSYNLPRSYTYLSGPIYLSGKLSMFSMDSVTLDSDETTFVGNFYYSDAARSFKINGTLSNDVGDSHQVAYYYDGNQPFENPPTMVSEVYLPGKTSTTCVLLPNTFDDDDQFEGWFSSETNVVYDGTRNYTSIYYNKGSTFSVNTWSSYSINSQVWFNLMERVSDSLPVYFGHILLTPFVNSYDDPTFVSEVDWENLSTSPLSASTFSLPANCMQ